MKITVIQATPKPLEVISRAAGTCYGKDDTKEKRVENCFKANHMSVFEHASITFKVEGISRACSHQLVRHRIASFSQQSQRYCKIDVNNDDWYVTPPSIEDLSMRDAVAFHIAMQDAGREYLTLIERGVKPEDARYLLPEATKTEIVVTMNLRELYHFLDLRLDKAAQWEIRKLAHNMLLAALEYDFEWGKLMELRNSDGKQ